MRYFSPTFLHLSLALLLLFIADARAQSDATNVRFTQGQATESAAVSLSVPIATFPGRGLNLPVGLTYSSAVWRIDHIKDVRNYGVAPPPHYVKQSVTRAIYSEHSKAGWKSGLDLPKIEWPKYDEVYTYQGKPAGCCWNYRVARVTIHMPDGSAHEFRKSDRFYISSEIDMAGTFYAVDGSRMRYDSTGPDTGTLFMPDGTRYILGHPNSYLIDRHGNTQSYNEGTRQWTDMLGRVIGNPIPSNPQAQDYTYSVPSLGGGVRAYTLKWRSLVNTLGPDAGNNIPSLRYVASHYLPNPTLMPTDSNAGNFPQQQSANHSLFHSEFVPPDAQTELPPYPVPVLVVGNGDSAGQFFNPVVLSEVVLPDGSSYKFTYNVYGELAKIVYPAGAYEQYEYSTTISDIDQQKQPYVQASRKLSSRKLSPDGGGTDIAEWKYSQLHSTAGYRKTLIVAPDNTRTEISTWDVTESVDTTGQRYWPFGQSPSKNGRVFETRAYSASPDGLGGAILRRELTQYEESVYTYTYTAPGINPPFTKTVSAYRNARPSKVVGLVFEGDAPALAQTAIFGYDTAREFSTGLDQTLASSYHFAVVANALAKDGQIQDMPLGLLAKYVETSYHDNPGYSDQNILGIPHTAEIKDSAGNVVSRSEMLYDECPQYCVTAGRALPTSLRTWDSTKGDATNPDAYLATHAKFDQYGNRIETTDAMGWVTTTVYDAARQAFPIEVVSPAPDPSGVHASAARFTNSTSYDFTTGLPLTMTDANGQTTTTEYNDALLRPTRVLAPNGQQTITEYGAGTSAATRWVRVRTQIDHQKWSEAVSKYDGLGRTCFNEKIDAQGNVFSETEYDLLGRVKRSSNPYRSGEAKQWTTPQYDDLGRTKKVISPDTAVVQISHGLSTTGVVGVTKTLIDQSGRERTGITDAVGNTVRVYEGGVAQNLLTDYVFDTLGNLRRTIQGEQSRYFMYDSLSRVILAKQPEQDINTAFIGTDAITGNSAWSRKYTYDDNGNVRTTTDARNISITGSYDRFNRLVTRDYSDSTADVNFYYDGTGLGSAAPAYSRGKATKVSSPISETRNTIFDSMGRLLASEQRTTPEQLAGTQTPYRFDYVYNLSGGLLEKTYPSGRVIRNAVNAVGELSQVQSKKTASHGFFTYADAFAYHSSGALARLQLGNGHWDTTAYDPERLQITKIGLGLTSVDQDLFALEFQYNSDGQADNNGSMRLQRIIVPSAGGNAAFTATQSYFYDSLNRIESAVETVLGNQTWKQSFSYDRYGNRRFDTANTTTLGSCTQAVCNPMINTANNRLASGQNYVYDAAGSVIRDAQGQRFGYDGESHLKEFFAASNQTSTPDATYYYDGEGRRVKKVVGNEVTVFVYDASGQLAAEYSTATAEPAQQAKVNYLTADHLGSPRIITDQYGRVTSRKDFTAFGDEVISAQRVGGPGGNGYDPPEIRQDYTGYEKDDESDLEFAQARYYSAAHGRFTSADPLMASATIKNPQTFNRYSYVINNPYKFVDPLGLALSDIGVEQRAEPYGARYLENNSTYRFQRAVRQPTTSTQTPAQSQVAVPQVLKDIAALNPREVRSDDTGEYIGYTILTNEEVAARVALITLAYNVGFAEGVREVQRENGDNVDVNSIQSTDGTESTASSQATTGGALSVGTNISATASTSESNTASNTQSGSMTKTATVVSGVGAAAADSARLAAARQNVVNSEFSVMRDVVNSRTGTVSMRVDPTKALDGFVRHGLTLGRAEGRLVYNRTRILQ